MKQGIYEQSIDQIYPIGKRIAIDDWALRYCHAGSTLRAMIEGLNGNFPREGSTDAVIYPAGTSQITIPMNPNGIHYAAEQVANYWKDGYIWIMQGAPEFAIGHGQLYRIKSSEAAVGGFATLTLKEPLRVQVEASTWITAWPSIYSDVRGISVPFGASTSRRSLVCLPLIPITADYYFWGVTWGPMFGICGYTAGRNDRDREVYYQEDHYGILPGSEIDFTTPNAIPQRIGYLLTNTSEWENVDGGAELGGDNFFMLQLAP